MKEKAILVVSFGTSYVETCAKTIEKMEDAAREAYPDHEVFRAWTSGIIRRKMAKRDGIQIWSVSEAMEQMHKKGIKEVVVQPTHVLNGIENEIMVKVIEAYRGFYEKVSVGKPLLTTREDCEEMVDLMIQEWELSDEEMLVFMGHGTEHHADFVYAAMNYQFLMKGHANMAMGTVEGYPTIEEMLQTAKQLKPKKVILTPFMIVAGDHANNDLAGDEEDSWKSIFEAEGYQVECVLKGLGEYEGVRRIFMEHLQEAVSSGK